MKGLCSVCVGDCTFSTGYGFGCTVPLRDEVHGGCACSCSFSTVGCAVSLLVEVRSGCACGHCVEAT